MRLDIGLVRYTTKDEYRVLVGIEMGMRNHEIVPKELVCQISKLSNGETYKLLSDLSSIRLVTRVREQKHEGYKLTVSGYDYLALYTLTKQGVINGVGNKIGVGKESDVYLVSDEEGNNLVLKLHRLGRTSFRKVKEKRDYLGNRTASSWLYLSRLSALRELTFMKLLYEHGFPVPKPYGNNRHSVVMSLVNGVPLQNIKELDAPSDLYEKIIDLLVNLASSGLIHSDYNEFNIMVDDLCNPILIDFPQMISIDHRDAEVHFNRDVQCIKSFFLRRFKLQITTDGPTLSEIKRNNMFLDIKSRASGAQVVSRKKLASLTEEHSTLNSDNSSEGSMPDTLDYDHFEENLDNEKIRRLGSDLSKMALNLPVNPEPSKNIEGALKKSFKKHISKKYSKPKKTKHSLLKDPDTRYANDQVKNFSQDIWG